MPIDMSAAVKAPPRKNAPRKAAASTAVATTVDTRTPFERRNQGLVELGQGAAGICLMTRQYADAAAVNQHFPPIARELALLADQHESIAKPIDFLIELGPWYGIVMAAMPLVLQIMANHKMLNAAAMAGMGVVPPDVLENQAKAQIARMQAAALAEQQEAMLEAQRAQQQYEETLAKTQASENGAKPQ